MINDPLPPVERQRAHSLWQICDCPLPDDGLQCSHLDTHQACRRILHRTVRLTSCSSLPDDGCTHDECSLEIPTCSWLIAKFARKPVPSVHYAHLFAIVC